MSYFKTFVSSDLPTAGKLNYFANNSLFRLRHGGEMVLHSKQVLMAVVILNLVDCCLVLGELVLDIHYIKGDRSRSSFFYWGFLTQHNLFICKSACSTLILTIKVLPSNICTAHYHIINNTFIQVWSTDNKGIYNILTSHT